MTDLHVSEWGSGEPVVMVHGSFSWGEATFAKQKELSDEFRLLILDRRGFGDSPPVQSVDFENDARDIIEVLGSGAHLVGHSYGGVCCLVAAGLRPEAVRSLTLIEPPALGLVRGNDATEIFIKRIEDLYQRKNSSSLEDFYRGFLQAFGFDIPGPVVLTEEEK